MSWLSRSARPGRISPAEARRRAAAGDAVLLDVRDAAEYAAGHAPGAAHLPLGQLTAGAPLPSAARGRPVMAVCRSGVRSQQAARILAQRGVDACDVSGGMLAWAAAGLPISVGPGSDGRPG